MARLVLLVVLALLAPHPAPAGERFAVIVHPSRTETIDVAELARIYLRKRRLWRDGTPIVPLNQAPGSPAREAFSRHVFGHDSAHLAGYWNEAYFEGVLPPEVLSSSAAVKRYVAAEPRAIGYIPSADVDGSVRAVLVLGEEAAPAAPPR